MLRYMSSGGLPCALGRCEEVKRGSGLKRGHAPVLPNLTLCPVSDGAAQAARFPKKPSFLKTRRNGRASLTSAAKKS